VKVVKQNPYTYYLLNTTLPPKDYAAYVIIIKTTAQPLRARDNLSYHGAIKKTGFAFRLIKIKVQKINQNIKC